MYLFLQFFKDQKIKLSSYLKTQSMYTPSSYHRYDIYNPFDNRYPKPINYSNYNEYEDCSSLARNLRAQKSDYIEQFRRQQQLIKKKQLEHYDILYGQNKRNNINNSISSQNLILFSKIDKFSQNPFLQGQSQSLMQLKARHADAKLQFMLQNERQQQWKMSQLNDQQQNQIKLKKILQNKQFRTIMELKNLQEYKKIKQAQKIKAQQSFTQRKSLLNIDRTQNQHGSTLFSFANEQAKKIGLKMSSRFANQRMDDNVLEDNLKVTFNGKESSGMFELRPAKRPPAIKRVNDSRDSLSGVRNSGIETSPKTIKLKNRTFYLIAT